MSFLTIIVKAGLVPHRVSGAGTGQLEAEVCRSVLS